MKKLLRVPLLIFLALWLSFLIIITGGASPVKAAAPTCPKVTVTLRIGTNSPASTVEVQNCPAPSPSISPSPSKTPPPASPTPSSTPSSSPSPAPILSALTTYVTSYGSGVAALTGNSVIIRARAYSPRGASTIGNLSTYVSAAVDSTDSWGILLEGNSLHITDSLLSMSEPWPYLTLTPDGNTYPQNVVIGTMTLTATRLFYSGNEIQLDLTLTQTGSFGDNIEMGAQDAVQYSQPWTETTAAQWTNNVVIPSPSPIPVVTPSATPSASQSPWPIPSSVVTLTPAYTSRGMGGGGAQYAVSFSPVSSLAFIATDMGTVFRSADNGNTWYAVDRAQLASYPLAQTNYVGFTGDPNIAFWVNNDLGKAANLPNYQMAAYRSYDQGLHWQPMTLPLLGTPSGSTEHVLYWEADLTDKTSALCITDQGVLVTHDAGLTWKRSSGISGAGQGTFVDTFATPTTIYHAAAGKLYVSSDRGTTFTFSALQPGTSALRAFAGGHDSAGITLAYTDSNGTNACAWAAPLNTNWGGTAANLAQTQNNCGYVWISKNGNSFAQTTMFGGSYLKMADNDSQTIYAVGGTNPGWQDYDGDAVFVSHNAGSTWFLTFAQNMSAALAPGGNPNWSAGIPGQSNSPVGPGSPMAWPILSPLGFQGTLSATALDIGWYDTGGFGGFAINQRNSQEAGGSMLFFSYFTHTGGNTWVAPFTTWMGTKPGATNPPTTGTPAPQNYWKSNGIDVTGDHHLYPHPTNSSVIYIGASDVGGMVSEDDGNTFRFCPDLRNEDYDFSFDPTNDQIVYYVNFGLHDFPIENSGAYYGFSGGLTYSTDRCKTVSIISPGSGVLAQPLLSAQYDPINKAIYAGGWGAGMEMSPDHGTTWSFINSGLPINPVPQPSLNITPNPTTTSGPDLLVPQIIIDPKSGNVYATMSSEDVTQASKSGIYFLDVEAGATSWRSLRGNVNIPTGACANQGDYMLFPFRFAIDFTQPEDPVTHVRPTIWMVDSAPKGLSMLMAMYPTGTNNCGGISNEAWGQSGVWKTTDGGANWTRKLVHMGAYDMYLDPQGRAYATGGGTDVYTPGGWGTGSMYSDDGGNTWAQNFAMAQKDVQAVVQDPLDPNSIFFGTYGSGILHGPRPPAVSLMLKAKKKTHIKKKK